MLRTIRLAVSDDSGQGLVEYAMIVALVALVCVAVLRLFAQNNNNSLSGSANKLPG